MQTEVVLSLGGNKGNREKLLFHAVESLNDRFQLVRVSKIYETAARGGVAKADFLNQLAQELIDMGVKVQLHLVK